MSADRADRDDALDRAGAAGGSDAARAGDAAGDGGRTGAADALPASANGGPSDGRARLRLANEFGTVAVEVDERANGPRLRIEDLRSGRVIHLDPLELASLTWLTHERLGPFLDPSQTGWRSDEGAWE